MRNYVSSVFAGIEETIGHLKHLYCYLSWILSLIPREARFIILSGICNASGTSSSWNFSATCDENMKDGPLLPPLRMLR